MIIGPRKAQLLGLIVFLVVCVILALPRMGFGQTVENVKTPRHLMPGYDYYTCEFLGHCPTGQGETYVPEMWKTVECYPAVGKHCPDAKPE